MALGCMVLEVSARIRIGAAAGLAFRNVGSVRHVGRQVAKSGVERGLHVACSAFDAAGQVELYGDARRAERGNRGELGDAGDFAERAAPAAQRPSRP